MELVLAKQSDLDKVRQLFKDIINDMHLKNVTIWSNYYPFFMFPKDIENKEMYLLKNDDEIISIFVLAKSNFGEPYIDWENKNAKVLYLDRFAVNVKYQGKGYGSLALKYAQKQSKNLGADYLRLFVVGCNIPAINLYKKNHYIKREGLYILKEDPNIQMSGYEIKL